jgi:hypothetical protein
MERAITSEFSSYSFIFVLQTVSLRCASLVERRRRRGINLSWTSAWCMVDPTEVLRCCGVMSVMGQRRDQETRGTKSMLRGRIMPFLGVVTKMMLDSMGRMERLGRRSISVAIGSDECACRPVRRPTEIVGPLFVLLPKRPCNLVS